MRVAVGATGDAWRESGVGRVSAGRGRFREFTPVGVRGWPRGVQCFRPLFGRGGSCYQSSTSLPPAEDWLHVGGRLAFYQREAGSLRLHCSLPVNGGIGGVLFELSGAFSFYVCVRWTASVAGRGGEMYIAGGGSF